MATNGCLALNDGNEETPTSSPPPAADAPPPSQAMRIRRRPTITVPSPGAHSLPAKVHPAPNNKPHACPIGSPAPESQPAVQSSAAHAMQILSDDMLCTLNKAIDLHNRRERFGAPTTLGHGQKSPDTSPSRSGGTRGVLPALSNTSNSAASSPEVESSAHSQDDAPRHPTNIFEDAPRMTSAVESRAAVDEALEGAPFRAISITSNLSMSENLRRKKTAAPHPNSIHNLPRFDKGLLVSALDAMDRTELAQLVVSMAEVLNYHSSRATACYSGAPPSHHGTSTIRVVDPHSTMPPLCSPPQSPWPLLSPQQQQQPHSTMQAFFGRPRPFGAYHMHVRQSITAAGDGGVPLAEEASMPAFSMPMTPQLPPTLGDHGLETSVSPSSLGTSVASVLRPTPKLTRNLVQYTDAEGFTTINNYMLLEEAGAGRFGKVCVANVVGTSELRAIKIIPKSRLRSRWQQLRHASVAMVPVSSISDPSDGTTASVAEDPALLSLNREVAVMKRLRHRNIVPLYEAIDDPHEKTMYLVMKYVEKGPIVQLDASWSCPPLDMDLVRCITRQTASGVAYLHKHHIAHRDIKPDNILLGADGVVYLSDFGVSQIFENDDRVTNSDGTPAYAAPEIVRGMGEYSAMKADIWALGVTIYTLVYGCAPFFAPSIFELNEKIVHQPVDYTVRGSMCREDDYCDVIDLLKRALERDPEERITAAELVKHSFVSRRRRSRKAADACAEEAPAGEGGTQDYTKAEDELVQGLTTSSDNNYSSDTQSSVGNITAEETYTAFTPLLPRPPPALSERHAHNRGWVGFE